MCIGRPHSFFHHHNTSVQRYTELDAVEYELSVIKGMLSEGLFFVEETIYWNVNESLHCLKILGEILLPCIKSIPVGWTGHKKKLPL